MENPIRKHSTSIRCRGGVRARTGRCAKTFPVSDCSPTGAERVAGRVPLPHCVPRLWPWQPAGASPRTGRQGLGSWGGGSSCDDSGPPIPRGLTNTPYPSPEASNPAPVSQTLPRRRAPRARDKAAPAAKRHNIHLSRGHLPAGEGRDGSATAGATRPPQPPPNLENETRRIEGVADAGRVQPRGQTGPV